MISDHLKFSPDILRRLGEELTPNPDQGIVELVRNSYDADALSCSVELVGADAIGGTVRVEDDGVGMPLEEIQAGWLVLGRSAKAGRRPTDLGRLPVGDKGLGRLAALRMGSKATLVTRPKLESGLEYSLTIDWSRFDDVAHVEEVPLSIDRRPTSLSSGTTIEIQHLNVKLGKREVQRLSRALLLLADPFQDAIGFRPRLVAPAFVDLEKRVKEAYFEDAEFRLSAQIDNQGRGTARVLDWKGQELWVADHRDLRNEPYDAPEATFELWVYILDSKTFSSRSVSVGEVQDWLKVVGGAHFYHRGLRVHPYGDPGHDWLDMNLRRARSPELRPSTNTSLGKVNVSDPHERLTQKTDRTGFVENDAFLEVRRFCVDALDWMARQRIGAREQKRQKERLETPRSVKRAKDLVDQAIEKVPPRVRSELSKAVQRLERARERESKALREELQLYRTLATVGTTAAIFAHESAKPTNEIEKLARSIERRGRKLLGDQYEEELKNPVQLVLESARALRSFAGYPLYLLQREKRRIGRVEIHKVIKDTYALFEPFLSDADIDVSLDLVDSNPVLRGSVAALEAIVANLLTNAANAFLLDGKIPARQVVIRTELSGDDLLLLRVLDNGPGIRYLTVEDIWLPGQTTVPGGTGLGLTIVRDSAIDLGGSAHALAKGELGGAEFAIELPIIGATP